MSCHSWKENKKNIISYTEERNMLKKEYNFTTSESLTHYFQTTDQHSYWQEQNTYYWRLQQQMQVPQDIPYEL